MAQASSTKSISSKKKAKINQKTDAEDEAEFNSFAQNAMDAIKEANQLEKEFNDLQKESE